MTAPGPRTLGLQELEPRIAFAIAPTLVADLNTVPNSSYPTIGDYGVEVGATAAGRLFIADDLTHGRELWVSDGTAAGTTLVKDVNPGPNGVGLIAASPMFNGSVFGILNRASTDYWSPNPTELWKTDGTAAGTVLVKHFADSWVPADDFVVVGDRLFFAVDGQVWKTDGTEAGTVTVDGFGGSSTGNSSVRLFTLGSTLYGLTAGSNGATIYRLTAAGVGTQVIALPSLSVNSAAGATGSVVVGNRLIFAAADGDGPTVVWSTDGTAAGTGAVSGANGPHGPEHFTAYAGGAFFNAADGTLWRTDGTTAGTSLVKDIDPGVGAVFMGDFAVAGEKLFFSAATSAVGSELWVSDGTAAGTKLVKDIAPGTSGLVPASSNPNWLTPFAGKLFFAANGDQLWKSDGTEAGTVLVKDTEPGSPPTGSGGFGAMAEFNGRLFFPTDDGVVGNELWSSDGTAAGTKVVKDIAPGTGDGVPGGSASYLAGAALGNLFLFAG
ncbi:MAG: hypothetical protein KGQ61_10730, partial [Planctomycetes bacterium]|nr:hypothetical protein [Planctomycetota bacterium]